MNKEILIAAGFSEQVRSFESKHCTTCGSSIGVHPHNPKENRFPLELAGQYGHGPFRDALSYKEYCISGMCQACQDKTFVEPENPCEKCNMKDSRYCKEECPM
jgi:hypothetical protein